MIARWLSDSENCGSVPMKYIEGKFSHEKDLIWNSGRKLRKGVYLIYVEIEWHEECKFTEYHVSVYSESNKVSLGDVTNQYNKEGILNKMLVAWAEHKTMPYEYEDQHQLHKTKSVKINLKRAMSVEDTGCDYGFIYYVNESPAAMLNEELNFSNLEGYSVDSSISPK